MKWNIYTIYIKYNVVYHFYKSIGSKIEKLVIIDSFAFPHVCSLEVFISFYLFSSIGSLKVKTNMFLPLYIYIYSKLFLCRKGRMMWYVGVGTLNLIVCFESYNIEMLIVL